MWPFRKKYRRPVITESDLSRVLLSTFWPIHLIQVPVSRKLGVVEGVRFDETLTGREEDLLTSFEWRYADGGKLNTQDLYFIKGFEAAWREAARRMRENADV